MSDGGGGGGDRGHVRVDGRRLKAPHSHMPLRADREMVASEQLWSGC